MYGLFKVCRQEQLGFQNCLYEHVSKLRLIVHIWYLIIARVVVGMYVFGCLGLGP